MFPYQPPLIWGIPTLLGKAWRPIKKSVLKGGILLTVFLYVHLGCGQILEETDKRLKTSKRKRELKIFKKKGRSKNENQLFLSFGRTSSGRSLKKYSKNVSFQKKPLSMFSWNDVQDNFKLKYKKLIVKNKQNKLQYHRPPSFLKKNNKSSYGRNKYLKIKNLNKTWISKRYNFKKPSHHHRNLSYNFALLSLPFLTPKAMSKNIYKVKSPYLIKRSHYHQYALTFNAIVPKARKGILKNIHGLWMGSLKFRIHKTKKPDYDLASYMGYSRIKTIRVSNTHPSFAHKKWKYKPNSPLKTAARKWNIFLVSSFKNFGEPREVKRKVKKPRFHKKEKLIWYE